MGLSRRPDGNLFILDPSEEVNTALRTVADKRQHSECKNHFWARPNFFIKTYSTQNWTNWGISFLKKS